MIRALAVALLLVWPGAAVAESLRLASFTVALDREGPGLFLRDLLKGDDQARAAAHVIAAAAPDAILLVRFDYDHGQAALTAFSGLIAAAGGPRYPHLFALRPNAGMAMSLDMDGDGRLRGPGDAQGWGAFAGQGGMAILSRLPVARAQALDFSAFLWRDLPGADLPATDAGPFPSAEAQAAQRLASTGAWSVPLALPGGDILPILVFHASPPVFDGPEDRNGRRNADEIRFWSRYFDGALPWEPPARFVLMGQANLDPDAGEGRRDAIRELLAHPRLVDPRPAAPTFPPLATGLWDKDDGPGPLRVSYILPSSGLTVIGAGLLGPGSDPALAARLAEDGLPAPLHRLVWVDLAPP